MRNHITNINTVPESALIFSEIFKGHDKLFSSTLTYENFLWDAKAADEAESVIPESLSFDLHLDMILNQGAQTLTEYYKNLTQGKNIILEQAKKKLGKNYSHKINESIVSFNRKVKRRAQKRLNENAISLDPTQLLLGKMKTAFPTFQNTQVQSNIPDGAEVTDNEVEAAIAGGEYSPQAKTSEDNAIMSLLKLLTEGGTTIGIIHLILDILGVLGDFVGLGAIFDILNAIIYFIRGKWLLGTISLIAAFVFGSGDALKLLKPGAKTAEPVMLAIIKGGGKEGGEALAKVSAKESGIVMKLLRFLAKNITGALGKATGILGKFFDVFLSRAVGWVPLIGKPLKAFFDMIGSTFAKYGDNLVKFSKEFKVAETTANSIFKKEVDASLDAVLKKTGNNVVVSEAPTKFSSGVAQVVDKNGKVISRQFPADWLTKGVNPEKLKAFNLTTPEAAAKFYSSIASSNSKIGEKLTSTLFKKGWKAAAKTAQFAAFIGKQFIKLATGEDPQSAGYTPEETEYFGNALMQDYFNSEIKKKRKETGATYLPYIELDSSEKEVFDNVTKYQNTYADLFGQPHIIPVIYDKYGKKDDEFKEAWSALGVKEKKKEVKESLKHVIPYSKFI